MKHLSILLLLSLLSIIANAQQNEFGIWGGSSTYFGDLNTETSFKCTHPAGGIFYRYNYDTRLCIKLSGSYGKVEGDDALAHNTFQQERNLSFFSNIYEGAVTGEFNFLDFNNNNPKDFFSPYICTGLGIFSFDPRTSYNGSVYRLQPLGTEGQGLPQYPGKKPYKLISTAWIIGGGFKFQISRNFNMFVEASERRTHTDYLDDVSGTYPARQVLLNEGGPLLANLSDRSLDKNVGETNRMRGDPQSNDKYLFIELGISITIISYKCPYQE